MQHSANLLVGIHAFRAAWSGLRQGIIISHDESPLEGSAMLSKRPATVLLALVYLAVGPLTGNASAITVELARKCEALTAKAFPPRVPGNPAAGSSKGTGSAQRDYFNKCVANEGKIK